ncbi:hypothetical protein N9795_00490 [Candidatus Pelagibacter sp.]|nr:hypothetical protein [Candidatus Pelagibacter sp.]
MRALTILATEIYQKLGQYSNLTERREATKHYILNEITQWVIKPVVFGDVRAFKPTEFSGDKSSSPFQVRLIHTPENGYDDLKFGNLNAENDGERYKWDDNDPNRLLKALFLRNVLEKEIIPLVKSGKVKGITFTPYDGDGLGDERYSYFYNMFSKLNTDKQYNLQNSGGSYLITKNKIE